MKNSFTIQKYYLKTKQLRTNQKHRLKIKQLRKIHVVTKSLPSKEKRIGLICLAGIIAFGLLWLSANCNAIPQWFKLEELCGKSLTTPLINIWQLLITAPILFAVWLLRDINRMNELSNSRKDTNLKEFQQLQRWATGNVPPRLNGDNTAEISLQISALHALRPYLKGAFGEDFRRGAFEIYASTLRTQHRKISKQLILKRLPLTFNNIKAEISYCELTSQLNRIASEEWFNLLINHDFSLTSLSLMGVNLKNCYLQRHWGPIGLDLSHVNFQGANLESAQLQGAVLNETEFQGAWLVDTIMDKAFLIGTQLQGANLCGANLKKAALTGVKLQNAILLSAQLQKANLRHVELQGADLRNANFEQARLFDLQVQAANLFEVEFKKAEFISIHIQGIQAINTMDFHELHFDEKIRSQVGKEADLSGVSRKMKLEIVDHAVGKSLFTKDTEKSAKYRYTKEKADEWITEYNKAMGFNS